MAEIPDVVTGEVISSDWGNDIRDRTVQRYATVAARSAAIPTPVEGDLSYLEDTGVVEVYDGANWVSLTTPAVVNATAQEQIGDAGVSTTFENGASISFTKPAAWATYRLTAWGAVMFVSAAGVGGGGIGSARVQIGANNGTARPMFVATVAAGITPYGDCSAVNEVSGLSASTTVTIQYNEAAAPVSKLSSWVSLTAVRTT